MEINTFPRRFMDRTCLIKKILNIFSKENPYMLLSKVDISK